MKLAYIIVSIALWVILFAMFTTQFYGGTNYLFSAVGGLLIGLNVAAKANHYFDD